jgi:hypothetical protein
VKKNKFFENLPARTKVIMHSAQMAVWAVLALAGMLKAEFGYNIVDDIRWLFPAILLIWFPICLALEFLQGDKSNQNPPDDAQHP